MQQYWFLTFQQEWKNLLYLIRVVNLARDCADEVLVLRCCLNGATRPAHVAIGPLQISSFWSLKEKISNPTFEVVAVTKETASLNKLLLTICLAWIHISLKWLIPIHCRHLANKFWRKIHDFIIIVFLNSHFIETKKTVYPTFHRWKICAFYSVKLLLTSVNIHQSMMQNFPLIHLQT